MSGTLAAARGRVGYRAALVASDREQFVAGRATLAGRGARSGPMRGLADTAKAVFVFPGQSSQWVGMARELLDSPSAAAFSASVAECTEALHEFVDFSVRDVLEGAPGAPSLERVDVAQPALFTMMVSLAALWNSYGVEPAAVVGHSQGEIAAAYVAGGLSLRDAARVVARGSRAWLTLSGQGGMASVPLPVDEVHLHLECWGDRLSIAAIDGPESVTVAGDPEALDALVGELSVAGVRSRRIPGVDTARNCTQVEVLRGRLLRELAHLTPTSSRIPFYSSVTGGRFDTAGLDTAYWYRNMREPVLFERATRSLVAHGHRCIIEVSPHPVLVAAMQETAQDAGTDVAVVGTLHRGDGGCARMLASLAEAHSHGVPADRDAVLAGRAARHLGLPAHVVDRQRHRPDPSSTRSTTGGEARGATGSEARGATGSDLRGGTGGEASGGVSDAGLEPSDHPLLGAAIELAGSGEYLLTGRISLAKHPWLADHAVGGAVSLPGAAFVELALEAAAQVGCGDVDLLALDVPLVLPARGDVRIQVAVAAADASGRRTLTVYSRAHGESAWLRHATGVLAPAPATSVTTPASAASPPSAIPPASPAPSVSRASPASPASSSSPTSLTSLVALTSSTFSISPAPPFGLPEEALQVPSCAGQADAGEAWPPAHAVRLSLDGHYEQLAELGFSYGPAFRGLTAMWQDGNEIFADVRLPDAIRGQAGSFGLHPALLDMALHAWGTRVPLARPRSPWASWRGVSLHTRGASVLRVRLSPTADGSVSAQIADGAGRPVATVGSLAGPAVPAADSGEVPTVAPTVVSSGRSAPRLRNIIRLPSRPGVPPAENTAVRRPSK